MNERVFNRPSESLRDPARMDLLEVERVVDLSTGRLRAESVLDIGTGTAIFAEAFAKRNFHVAGIDIKSAMIEAAKKTVPSGEFKIGGAEKIPFKDGTFDIVFFGLVLHETDDPRQALIEARRVGRKRVVVLEWPYAPDEKGPPLEHKLKPGDINRFAEQAGLGKPETIALRRLVIYLMEIV
jgi:ubiquinone/menaquinone biosynthesis C-methylase UbiE